MPTSLRRCRFWTHAVMTLVAGAAAVGQLAAQSSPSRNDHVQLAVRQPAPAGRILRVVFSQDERMAAAADIDNVFVYDLDAAIEIRRIAIESPNPFGSAIGFSSRGDELYVQDGLRVKACPLERDVACHQLSVSGALTSTATLGFAVGRDDLLLSANGGVPVVVNVPLSRSTPLRETVPAGDRDDFKWAWGAFDDALHAPTEIAIAGSIEREGRSNRTTEEWHVSVFNISTGAPSISYLRLPVTVTMLAFATTGDLYVCGGDPGAEFDNPTPPRLYNVSRRTYEDVRAVKQLLSPNVVWSCGGDPGMVASAPIGSYSPSLKRIVQQGFNGWLGQGLYVAPADRSTPPVALTAGDTTPATRVEFTANPMVLATHSAGTQLWDLSTGQVASSPVDVHFSRDATFAGWMQPDPSGRSLQLVVQDRRDGNKPPDVFPLGEPPRWFDVVDGETVVFQTDRKLTVQHPGGTTDLDCEPIADKRSWTAVQPEIDVSGTRLSALCEIRRAYVTWSLRPLREINVVPFPDGEVFVRTSDPTRVLALESTGNGTARVQSRGRRRIDRIVNLVSGESSPLPGLTLAPDARLFDELIAATITPDGGTLVLAFHDITNAGDRVEWRRVASASTIVKSVSGLPRVIQLAASPTGAVAVLTEVGVRLYSPDGADSIQLLTGVSGQTNGDWLAFTDDGMFDGTSTAMHWVGLKWSDREPLLTLDVLFNELYRPGLLRGFAGGSKAPVPNPIPFSLYATVPGLKLLLQQDELRPAAMASGQVALCVRRPALFDALRNRRQGIDEPGFVRDDDPACPNRIVIRPQVDASSLVAALSELRTAGMKTPWDGQTIQPGQGVTHVVTFAVEAAPDLAPMPTAAVSAQAIERALSQNAVGGRVRLWSRESACGSGQPETVAAKNTILNCLRQVAAAAAPEDMVVVFLAGHGGAPPGTELFYYYPADYTQSAGVRSALSAAELADAVRALRAQRLVLIVDTCDAGAAVEPLLGVVTARMLGAATQGASQAPDANRQGAVLIGASTAAETAATTREVNPFVTLLIDALKTAGANDGVTWSHGLTDAIRNSTFRVGGLPATAVAVGANFAIARQPVQR